MLALLGTVMLVGPGAAQGENDEAQTPLQSGVLDDRGRTSPRSLGLRLLPVGFNVPMLTELVASAAPPTGQTDAASDNPRPVALAATSGQTETADGEPVEAKPAPGAEGVVAPITFYSCQGPRGGFCGAMSSGKTVYEGAAACGSAYALGERVSIAGDPTERGYVCEDRGRLAPTQVDVFWYREEDGRAWIAQVGRWAEVRREP